MELTNLRLIVGLLLHTEHFRVGSSKFFFFYKHITHTLTVDSNILRSKPDTVNA